MGLAGNILCSIGGSPKVYGHGLTPSYPCRLFYENIALALKPATKDTIGTFVSVSLFSCYFMNCEDIETIPRERQIEKPEQPVWALREDRHILSDYHSIGTFYRDLINGMHLA